MLEITDDGAGFDPAAVSGRGGLGGMAERAAQVGGRLTVESTPGYGTQVRVEVEVMTENAETIRVMIADDHLVVCQGIRAFLATGNPVAHRAPPS
jgi:signal transduction histidine kinase